LTVMLVDDIAPARRELPLLPPEIADELDRRLTKLRGGAASILVTTGMFGGFVGGTVVGSVFLDPGVGVMMGGGAAALVGTVRSRIYGHWVRVPLATVLAEVGVTRACARERMRQRGGRLAKFAQSAGDDNAMRLFGMVTACATTWAEGGGPVWQPAW
jgi:hypothetical protein